VAGHSLVHKFGRSDAVPNGSWVAITPLAALTFLTGATAVRIKAGGNAADDTAGAGARQIMVTGIDTTLAEVTETITTAGAAASSPTSAAFWRPYRLAVKLVGTYGVANTGDIIVENAAGGTDLIMIVAGKGRSQHGQYSTPTGKTGYLLSVHITVDSNKAANIRLFVREIFTGVAIPAKPISLRLYWDHITGTFTYVPRSPKLSLPALSDIWVEAWGDGAISEVSVDFEILLVDD
jgi:hypothetical protein